MSHLATTEQNRHLNFIVVLEKTNGLFDLELDIVFAGLGLYANLFALGLELLTLSAAFALVILELSKVHDAAYRRFGFGRDLDEIKPAFTSLLKCVCCRNDA